MKIFCIGRNYAKHASELKNEVPEQPVVFMKPPTALLKKGQSFYYPNFSKEIHFEGELVLRIGKNGKSIAPQFAAKYISSYTLGFDFTARDLQTKLKSKGLPWEIAKGFDGAAAIGELTDYNGEDFSSLEFEIHKNKELVQKGSPSEMLFPIPQLISFTSNYYTLQQGDLIYTGTPAGVGPINIGDKLEGFFKKKKVLETLIK